MFGRTLTYDLGAEQISEALRLAFTDLVENFTMEPIEGWQLWQNLDGDRRFKLLVTVDESQGTTGIRLALHEDRPEAEVNDLLDRLKTAVDWRLKRAAI